MKIKKLFITLLTALCSLFLITACGGVPMNSSSESMEESSLEVISSEEISSEEESSSEVISSEEISSEEESSSEVISSEEISSEESSSEVISSEEISSEESSSEVISSEEISSEESSSEVISSEEISSEEESSSEEISSEEISSEESSSEVISSEEISSEESSSEEVSIEEISSEEESSEVISSEEVSSEEESSSEVISSEEVSSEEESSSEVISSEEVSSEEASSSEEMSSEDSSFEDSSSSEEDSSSSSEEENLKDFPVVNASALVDFVVEVEEGRDPIVLMLSDTQIIDASQQRTDARLNGAYSVLNTRWARGNVEDRAFRYIREAISRANPDLILLVGDNVYGEFDDSGYVTQAFIEFMDSFNIPWAPVMGNHDCETAMGQDWLCQQYENASNCLFQRNTLTGNGNYSIGITQGGKLVRTFFMLDSASSRTSSKRSPYGFASDEIAWYTNKITAIKNASAPTGISVMTHVPMQAFVDYLVNTYGYTNVTNETLNLDNVGKNGDFGIVNEGMDSWDTNYTVWNGLKSLGVDSVFVGHVHGVSAGFKLDGVHVQFGLKTGTYDALNYDDGNGNIVWNYSDMGDPITGATVIPVSKKDGTVSPYHIVTELEEDKTFNETLTALEKDTELTTIHITTVGAHSVSSQNTLYLKFLDYMGMVHFLELPVDTNSTNNTALENFAKQIIFNGVNTFNNVGVITSQQDTNKENFNVMFQLTDGANVNRFQYIRIPKGTTYECDADGNGKIDTVWTFDREFKIVYDPYACTVRNGLGGCNGSCDAGEWHIYTFEAVTTAGTMYEITSGSIYGPISKANSNIGFRFISTSGTVNLGYTTTTWTAPDDACNAFKKYIKINGNALPTTATLQGIDQTDGLYLAGISLSVNDTITIEKGATFTHGDYTMIFTKTLTWTWTGTTYTCTAS